MKTDDYGRDLSSVQTLLTKQETFDAGLQAFQQEGIAIITALKDQLLAAKHVQSKAIKAHHAALMKRWSQLLANSATRKKKLLEAQSHFRKVSAALASSAHMDGKPSSAQRHGININQPGGALVFMRLLLWKHLGH